MGRQWLRHLSIRLGPGSVCGPRQVPSAEQGSVPVTASRAPGSCSSLQPSALFPDLFFLGPHSQPSSAVSAVCNYYGFQNNQIQEKSASSESTGFTVCSESENSGLTLGVPGRSQVWAQGRWHSKEQEPPCLGLIGVPSREVRPVPWASAASVGPEVWQGLCLGVLQICSRRTLLAEGRQLAFALEGHLSPRKRGTAAEPRPRCVPSCSCPHPDCVQGLPQAST